MNKEFLKIRETMKYLNIGHPKLVQMIEDGLPVYVLDDRTKYISIYDIRAYMQKFKVVSNGQGQ